jgi:hypothetical protein
MHFQVDQDIDLVATHQVGDLLVGVPYRAPPKIDVAL